MSDNFDVFLNKMAESLFENFAYDYDTVEVASNKIEVCVVDENAFTALFKRCFLTRIDLVAKDFEEDFEKYGYNPKPTVVQEIDTIKVTWYEKKQK